METSREPIPTKGNATKEPKEVSGRVVFNIIFKRIEKEIELTTAHQEKELNPNKYLEDKAKLQVLNKLWNELSENKYSICTED